MLFKKVLAECSDIKCAVKILFNFNFNMLTDCLQCIYLLVFVFKN